MSNYEIKQEELDGIKVHFNQAIILELLESIENNIIDGRNIVFKDFDDNIVQVLKTSDDFVRWKDQNKSWLPDDNEKNN